MPYEPRNFDHLVGKLDGLSERQIREHFTLYQGYVKKANEIEEKLMRANPKDGNATYAEIRELLVEQTYAYNGITLHEYYFGNLGGKGGDPTGTKIRDALQRDFGGLENYREQMRGAGMSARGWVVTAMNLRDGKLHNYALDFHNAWVPMPALPVVVMDVYEHAYFIDYGTKRTDYITTFFKNLNWEICEERITRISGMKPGLEWTK